MLSSRHGAIPRPIAFAGRRVARRRVDAGFSLLEVLVTLTIATVLVGLALPLFGDTRVAHIASAYEELHSHLLLAQSASMANPTSPAGIVLYPSGYGVQGTSPGVDITFAMQSDTKGVALSWTDTPDGRLDFNHYGALDMDPDAPNPVLRLSIPGCSTAMEVTLFGSSGTIQGEWISVN